APQQKTAAAPAQAPQKAPAAPAPQRPAPQQTPAQTRTAQQSPASGRDGGSREASPPDMTPVISKEELRRTRSSPLGRKIAAEHGVDISGMEGTGLSGRVTKQDIMAYLDRGASAAPEPARGRATTQAPAPQPAMQFRPGESTRVEPMTTIRRKIA